MNIVYDVAIIGGGIAGLSAGFFLKLGGAKTVLISDVMKGASLAAGAFLHPVIGKASNVKNFSDKAYESAIDFYTKYCDYEPIGAWLGAKDETSVGEFMALSKFLNVDASFVQNPQEFNSDGCGAFFITSAGRISPKAVADKLVSAFDDVLIFQAQNITKNGDIWSIDGKVLAKNIVFACGAGDFSFNRPYLKASHRGVWGQKAIIQAYKAPKSAISLRGILISEGLEDGKVAIGATHVPSEKPLEITREISKNLALKALKFYDFGKYEILEELGGMRSASTDYFPIVGKIYDDEAALRAYPQMKDGMIPRNLPTYDGLFVHYGHGSRAFTTSIFTAQSLADLILNKKELPKELDTKRLLVRYARKSAIIR